MNLFTRMKKIEISTIVDFLRRILESGDFDKIQAKDERCFKSIYYIIGENEYISIYIGDDYVSYSDVHVSKDIECIGEDRLDLLFYFNKIFGKKEELAFNNIDKAFRYIKQS